MKLLVDQNISYRIVPRIQVQFPETFHVKVLGLTDMDDFQIFKFARQNAFDAVLTMDEDFYNIQLEHGIPPKIIWLRIGNCSTAEIAEIVLQNVDNIAQFHSDSGHDCLEIFK